LLIGVLGGLTDLEMIRVTREQNLDDATRAALASGRAAPALGLFIDTLTALRGISEQEGEALAGAMLETEVPAAMSPHALDMVFAAIERGGPARKRELVYAELASLPVDLRESVREAESQRTWKVAGPGIRRLELAKDGPLKLEIIRLDAGMAVPWHTHKGHELTLCVHGEYADGLDSYGPGDFSITEGAIRHQPKAWDAGPAYALVVTDAGLRFEGLLGALQKLFGQ
jgi:putative transcriptional regulator